MKQYTLQGALVALLILVSAPAYAGAFDGFGGRWVGKGAIQMSSGESENMRCVATYFPSKNGTSLSLNVRCANASLKIDVKGALQALDNHIRGTFEERNYENRGTVSGTAGNGTIEATVRGDEWLASISVSGHGAKVVMRPHSGPVKRASFTFQRG